MSMLILYIKKFKYFIINFNTLEQWLFLKIKLA